MPYASPASSTESEPIWICALPTKKLLSAMKSVSFSEPNFRAKSVIKWSLGNDWIEMITFAGSASCLTGDGPHRPGIQNGEALAGMALNSSFSKNRCTCPQRLKPISFNINMIGPLLIAFGDEQQKKHFLPKIARMDYWFCQGFSEPGAGSDLAALRTSAVRNGDHYVVNGQKLWTSTAHNADWMFLLVRTDSSGKRQEGITYLLVDMKSPGITIRPIITIDGHHETNELFLDNVQVPVSNRVGEEHKGWGYAKFLLGHEPQRHRQGWRVQDARAACQATGGKGNVERQSAQQRSPVPRTRGRHPKSNSKHWK